MRIRVTMPFFRVQLLSMFSWYDRHVLVTSKLTYWPFEDSIQFHIRDDIQYGIKDFFFFFFFF